MEERETRVRDEMAELPTASIVVMRERNETWEAGLEVLLRLSPAG